MVAKPPSKIGIFMGIGGASTLIFRAYLSEKLHRQKPVFGTIAHSVNMISQTWAGADLINCYMMKRCSSANRCARIECPTCARRYARHVARDFVCSATGPIHTITISAGIDGLDDFKRWRVGVWNIVTYRRQGCRWWRDIHLRLWFCRDGCVRGIVALGSITETEFLSALGERWPITLRRIDGETLLRELYTVVRPDIIMADDLGRARYQPRQMTVRPHRVRSPQRGTTPVFLPDLFTEPMPMLIA